jgi:hypothetical protein
VSHREWLEQLSSAAARLLGDLGDAHAPALHRLCGDLADLHVRVKADLDRERRDHPRVLVFLCGTALMHGGAAGLSRDERVVQARAGADPSLRDYGAYVPTEGAIEKLRGWSDQGAQITYFSYHREAADVAAAESVVLTCGFPSGSVLYRGEGESCGDVVERVAPDILIEGDRATAYDELEPARREQVVSIVVPEFGGLGHLPARVSSLAGVA